MAVAQRDDPVVPGRARRPVEPRRGRHGPGCHGAPGRGGGRIPVAGGEPASIGCLAPVLPGRRDRGPQVRRQRDRLRGHRGVAPLAADRRPGIPGVDVVGRGAGDRLRTGPSDPPWRDPVGQARGRHTMVVRPVDGIGQHLPQPAMRGGRGRGDGPRATRLGTLAGPPGPRGTYPARRGLRAEGPLGDGLVLPGAGRCHHRRRRQAPPGRPPPRVRDGGPGRPLRQRQGLGDRGRDQRVRHCPPAGGGP